jgi:hypothetical protein
MGLFSRKSTKNETPSSVILGRNVAYQSPRKMVPKIALPPAPDPAEDPAAYLRSIYAVSLARRRTWHGATPMDHDQRCAYNATGKTTDEDCAGEGQKEPVEALRR